MFAAARIGIDDIDQLGDGVHAVADDLGRLAPRRGHHVVAHDQQAIVVAGGELFDQHRFAFLASGFVGGHNLLAGGKIRGHAAALVAVLRLDDHRHADFAGGLPGVFGAGHRPAVGSGHAHRAQQHAGQFFVLRDRFGDGAGAIGFGRLNAPLLAAVAELHQAVGVQPPHGNAPGFGGFDDRAGARAKAHLLRQIAEPIDFAGDVEGPIVDRRQEKLGGDFQAFAAQVFFDISEDDAIDAFFRSFAGLAEADRRAGQRLQFQRDVFEDMGGIGSHAQSLEEAAALADAATMLDHRRHPAHQSFVEAGDFVGRRILQFAQIDPRFDHREVGPNVRATQRQYLAEFHGCVSR